MSDIHPTPPGVRRTPARRAVVVLPNGLTVANLFFGVWAIVAAARGSFATAGLYVVLGGVADMLDGRVARATRTGSNFGSELDSLVDAISFGLAPAMIMYFAVLNRDGWDWIWSFIFVACAVVRLARFNVEQAGREKSYFHGLPSPAAGITLATYYWFSQTPLYNETNIAGWPWHQMLRLVMGGLAVLMISDVSYPAFPRVGYRRPSEIVGSIVVLATIAGVFFLPRQFFFPAGVLYVVYGLVRTVVMGLLDRRNTGDSPVIADDLIGRHGPGETHGFAHSAAAEHPAGANAHVQRRRRRRRPPRGDARNQSNGE